VRECCRSKSSPEEPSPQSKAFTSGSPLVSGDACTSSEGRTWVGPRGRGLGDDPQTRNDQITLCARKILWVEEMGGNERKFQAS
jgi:hypothetical protein